MAAPRFFCDTPLSSGARITLPTTLAHHALRVLRLPAGTPIALFDGLGGEYPAVLDIEGKQGYAQLGDFTPREAELAGRLTVVQGLPAGDKMDWVIEKTAELGATALVPITAQRSVLQLTGPRLEKRMAHWHRIAQAASEQCGRNHVLQVHPPQSLRDWLALPSDGLRLLCHPDGETSLASALQAPSPITALSLIVGPEGGWSPAELAHARAAGVQTVKFGPRVLRTETAALALMAATTALLNW